ncbi:MAG: hypothetical protein LBD23_20760 [Oscillospiraceae bacterium]|nr:hypothetical protein [Oscillospiraceae bacterium]
MLAFTENNTHVEEFLSKLKSVLCSKKFDVNRDLDIQFSVIEGEPGYLNAQTLNDLGYTIIDVRSTLLSLKVQNYSETMFDKKDLTGPGFRVFGRIIDTKEVYIKVKIRKRDKNEVFCISFHYSQYPIAYPFKT